MSAPDPYLLATALEWLAQGRGVAIATVLQTWGSAPQPVGSQLLIDADGNFLGSVSGGCVEAEVVAQASDVISTGAPKELEFGVEDAAVNESLKTPDLQQSFAKMSFETKVMSSQEFASFFAAEAAKWPPIVKAAGIKPE